MIARAAVKEALNMIGLRLKSDTLAFPLLLLLEVTPAYFQVALGDLPLR